MNSRKLSMTTPEALWVEIEDEEEVIAASQLVEDDGRIILNIDLYWEGRLRARWFADKHEMKYTAYLDGERCKLSISNIARKIRGRTILTGGEYYWYDHEFKFASNKDREIATEYLKCSTARFEYDIVRERRERREARKQESINKIMESVPRVPEEFKAWVDQVILPGHILFTQTKGKRDYYSCTACGQSGWKKAAWKDRGKGICPKCGQEAAINKRCRQKESDKTVYILQQAGEEWVERKFVAYGKWEQGKKKEVKLCEDIRAIVPKGERWGKVYYGVRYQREESEQIWSDKNTLNHTFTKGYLWPGNLNQILPLIGMDRSGLDILARRADKINVNRYICAYDDIRFTEYLIKAGLYKLADEVIDMGWYAADSICADKNAVKLKDLLRLDGNRMSRLKKMDGGVIALKWLRYEERSGKKISQEALEYLEKKRISVNECTFAARTGLSTDRIANYIKKQGGSARKTLSTWRDYLNMAQEEGSDITDDIIRTPKDLKRRHDELVEIGIQRNQAQRVEAIARTNQQTNAEISTHWLETEKYHWEDDNYVIMPAKTCEDLEKESRELHHCVGTSRVYMNKMAAGTGWICFLRKKGEEETPYYTLEIDMQTDNILQWYSAFNRKPDAQIIEKVLDRFKREVKSGKREIRARIKAIA